MIFFLAICVGIYQSTALPTLKINVNASKVTSGDVWVEGVSYSLLDDNGKEVSKGSTDIKLRGHDTATQDKKPYALKLSSKASLLGMPEHKRWQLLANHFDNTLLRNEAAFEVGRILDGMAWTPHAQQVGLYLSGAYVGVYQLVEAIKIDPYRVNITEIKKGTPTGGYILEIDNKYHGEEFFMTTEIAGVLFSCSDPDEDLLDVGKGDARSLVQIMADSVQAAEYALYSNEFQNTTLGYRKYLDVDSFVDWFLAEEIVKDYEILVRNGRYMYYDDGKKKYCMGPLWDYDISFANHRATMPDGLSPEGFIVKDFDLWWTARLFEDPYFVSAVKARWNKKKAELATVVSFVEKRAAALDSAQAENFERWTDRLEGRAYAEWVGDLTAWISTRLAWLDAAINDL